MLQQSSHDALLFEDDSLSRVRLYFWAERTLITVNLEIRALIDVYKNSFTQAVWAGKHEYIWPGEEADSPRYKFWRSRMRELEGSFDSEISRLHQALSSNEAAQEQLHTLHSCLYSGTSILSIRTSMPDLDYMVVQANNIKILTLVAVLFLPPLYVASIFGMTNMPTSGSFVRFGITMVALCVPTYAIVFSLNFDAGFEVWSKLPSFTHEIQRDLVVRSISTFRRFISLKIHSCK